MKKKLTTIMTVVIATLLLCSTVILAGCKDKPQQLTDNPLAAEKIADFTKTADDRSEVFESGPWDNGEPFNSYWIPDNVSYEGGKMSLSISEMTTKPDNVLIAEYYGGEGRTKHYYGYGDFQVRMKPSNVKGTASTFFTCTGNYDQWYNEEGEVVKQNPHDEIDIEFLGSDTTKVQFNYFANGVGGHEYMYDLGFDASKEFHDYGFRWTENDITWFVDEKPVYKVEKANIKKGETWPSEPGRILMNYWCGTEKASNWMGKFEDDFSGRAEYEWAATSAAPQIDPNTTKPGNQPQPSEPIPTDIEWDENTYIDFKDTSGGVYTITGDEANKKLNITYTEAKQNSYNNVKGELAATGRNHFGITLESKTDKPVNVRINLRDKEKNLAKKSYVSEGETSIADGAFVTVPANGSVDAVVYYEGTLAEVELMIDSTNNATAAVNAGEIEVSNIKLGVKGEVIESELSKNGGISINGNDVKFTGSSEYNVETSEDKSTMTVSYTDLPPAKYQTLIGDTSAFVGDNNTFTLKIKNEGADTAKIRIDIMCPAGQGTPFSNPNDGEGKNDFCNTSAVVTGAEANGNDYAYKGGDWIKIAAGETATVTITFTAGLGGNGIRMFLDSSTWDDTVNHTSTLVFSDMAFSKVA